MGLLEKLIQWGKWALGHENTAAAAKSTYTVVAGLFDQVGAIPRVVYDAVTHPPTRKVAKHLGYIAGDLAALITFTFGARMLFEKLFGNEPDNQEPDNGWFNSTILICFYTLDHIVALRNTLKIQGHLLITNFEAAGLNVTRRPAELCSTSCRPLDAIEGLAGYWATELPLVAMQNIAIPGIPRSITSRVIQLIIMRHNGGYLLGSALPEWCDAHRREYVSANSELAFSLGIGHAISSLLAVSLLENTGIPPAYYSTVISMLMLIVHMSLVSHMKLPEPKAGSNNTLDPLGLYQEVVAISVETLMLGLERKIPRMLDAGSGKNNLAKLIKNLPWTRMGNGVVAVWNNRVAYIILPRFLQNLDNFAKDPVVRDSLPALQKSLITILRGIESADDHWLVNVATKAPWLSGLAVHYLYGVPVFATKAALVNKEFVAKFAHDLRLIVENMQPEEAKPVTVDLNALQTDGYVAQTALAEKGSARSSVASSADPSRVIRRPRAAPPASRSPQSAANVIKIPTRLTLHAPQRPATPPEEDQEHALAAGGWEVLS